MAQYRIASHGPQKVGAIVLPHGVRIDVISGVPTDGTTGTLAGKAPKGSRLINKTTGQMYTNAGTKASPTWMAEGGSNGPREAKNTTGGALAAGALVYLSSWDETAAVPIVAKADADAAGRSAEFVVLEAIANNAVGLIGKTFRLTAQNTAAANAVGDPVYLDTTAGGWVIAAPTGADDVVQVVGRVAVDHAATGVVEFDIRSFTQIGTNEYQAKSVTGPKIALTNTHILVGDAGGAAADVVMSGDATMANTGALTIAALAITAANLAAAVTTMINGLRTWLTDGMFAISTLTVSGVAAEKFKTTTTAIYNIAGLVYSKAATDNLVFSVADTINTAAGAGMLWGIWLVQIDAAGTITTTPGAVDMTYANEAAAIAALPAVTAANVQLGYITVQALEATDWVANTDNLTVGGGAGNCTARSFYNLPAAKSLPAAL